MRICIVTHKVVKGDGQGRVNYEIARAAIDQGYKVFLLASEIDQELEAHDLIDWIRISATGLPTAFVKNLIFSFKTFRWLQKHHIEFDILKINGAITSFPSDINAVHFVHSSWLKSPVHTWQQRKDLYGFYQLLYTSINSYWEKQAFAKAKRLVAVSKQVKHDLIKIGISPEKITIITNGVDLKEFASGKSDRTSLGLPLNVPIAFFVGDIRTPRKNLDTVLKALAEIPDLHLAVAGSTEGSPYPELATSLNVANRTHFLGYRTDIAKLMKAVDMFVFPSRYEPFGLVVIEAMASGLPVVTANTAGVSQIVTSECGKVLYSEDIQGLTKFLNKLINDSYLRRQMGKAGQAIAEQHSWQSKAQSYLKVFQELVK